MKSRSCIAILLALGPHLILPAQDAQWAQKITGIGTDMAEVICRDELDNVYVAGELHSVGQIDGHLITPSTCAGPMRAIRPPSERTSVLPVMADFWPSMMQAMVRACGYDTRIKAI